MAEKNSTLKVLDYLKSDVPSSEEITDSAKKKKKKKQGEMNKKIKGQELAPSDDL